MSTLTWFHSPALAHLKRLFTFGLCVTTTTTTAEIFENIAFSLSKENPISEPFKSEYGWHIVKFNEKYPLKSLDESKKELENKISRDDRSRIITNTLTEKLRKKYTVKRNEKVYKALATMVTPEFYESKWEYTDNENTKAVLVTLDKKELSGKSFLEYVKTQQKTGVSLKPVNKLVDLLYGKFIDENLNSYYNDNLETEFPDFSFVMDEYRDGLLLFDLMEKEIWDRSKTDTLGLKAFYETQKDKHKWKTRLDLIIASSTNMEMVKKAQAMLKKGKFIQEIKDKLNTKDVVNIMLTESTVEISDPTVPKGTKPEEGTSEISQNGEYYYATKVNKVIPETNKSFDECKGKIVNDYQQYLEQNWVNELKKEFKVNVNQSVFEKLKTTIK